MEEHHDREDILLGQQSSSLSDNTFGSNSTVIASPVSPTSLKIDYEHDHVSPVLGKDNPQRVDRTLHSSSKASRGLGITNLSNQRRGSTRYSQSVPGSADPLYSPSSATLSDVDGIHYELDEGSPYNPTSSDYEDFTVDPERERLHEKSSSGLGIDRNFACGSKRPLASGRSSKGVILILALSVFSTVFSAIWLGIAVWKPHFDNIITTGKALKNVNVLCAVLARLIELSFISVFVALVRQILSTRAMGAKKGVTLAEMLMQSWVSQPFSIITHWESVRYAGYTWLGLIALLVAVLSLFYTTASNALVAPHLTIMYQDGWMLHGKVATSFANVSHVKDQCTTPLDKTTCIEIQHSGQAYHNYLQYLAVWVEYLRYNGSSAVQSERPLPVAVSTNSMFSRT